MRSGSRTRLFQCRALRHFAPFRWHLRIVGDLLRPLRKWLLRKGLLSRRVRLHTFPPHPHSHPFRHPSTTYFQVLGSARKPVKLLKVLDIRELARSHSTTELLPLNFMSINEAVPGEQTWLPVRAMVPRVAATAELRSAWTLRLRSGQAYEAGVPTRAGYSKAESALMDSDYGHVSAQRLENDNCSCGV